jgi:1-acyl-sn-glycerol-3-phosphate acyltransferase
MTQQTWPGEGPLPEPVRFGLIGWLRVLLRGLVLGTLTFGGLLILLQVRLVERPLFGQRRPMTPFITQFVCLNAFRILGMRYLTRGTPLHGQGAVVSNHCSWLDIFALNARKRIYFVSKDELADWPGIGWLARATGTVFIRRERREATAQIKLFEERLSYGHKLLFFPEGTTSDSRRVLPFKSTLFAAFFAPEMRDTLQVQPVTLRYQAREAQDARFYGFWAEMIFGAHLLKVLAARNGSVEVLYHPPVKVADFKDRKALAAYCEAEVRKGLDGLV